MVALITLLLDLNPIKFFSFRINKFNKENLLIFKFWFDCHCLGAKSIILNLVKVCFICFRKLLFWETDRVELWFLRSNANLLVHWPWKDEKT